MQSPWPNPSSTTTTHNVQIDLMATSQLSLLSCSLLLLLFCCQGSVAQIFGYGQQQPWGSQRRFGQLSHQQCQLESLSAQEPLRRVESEAGFTEYYDECHEQLQCAGVAARRRTIEPRGLVLPSYSNTPRLVYMIQGRGIIGTVFPGCPESYQSFRQAEEQFGEAGDQQQSQRRVDEHQKVRRFQQGDVLALPAGVTAWFYNDGDSPAVSITVFDTSSNANQLGPQRREFLLAGGQRRTEHSTRPEEKFQEKNNMLSGFSTELISEALGIDSELARRIQQTNVEQQRRGEIVRVRHGLQFLSPLRAGQQIREGDEEVTGTRRSREEECRGAAGSNGLEETYCYMKKVENIENPMRADVYNPRWGRLTSLNSQKLPILRFIQMSAERGVLHRNAIYAPHWNINAHSIVYVIRGSCRLQVVGHRGRTAFDGELRQGQLFVIPQNYAVVKRSQSERFEWISFKTNDNAMVSQIVGKSSALRGMPLEVLMSSYQISREEARRIKFNRGQETSVFSPRHEATIAQPSA